MIEDCVNPWLRKLEVYETGKPIEETARELGLDPSRIVKLASNENPLGPSPLAIQAMTRCLPKTHLYPDGGGWFLRSALSERFGLPLDHIVLGNGSNEIIEFLGHSFLHPGVDVVVSSHAFLVYKLMAELFGADVREVPDPDFRHDLKGMLAAITPQTRLVFVANPNNPTGTVVTQEELDVFVRGLPPHVIAVFDEAYFEFFEGAPDTLRYIREGRSVVVMRTFSKAQGLAGLRIGYGFAPPSIAAWLQRSRQPFNANAVAQAGALAALADQSHITKTCALTRQGMAFLQEEFDRMGLEWTPSQANFILVKIGAGRDCFQRLLQKGVIVRAMDAYKLPDHIRVTVGTESENVQFIQALEELLRERGR